MTDTTIYEVARASLSYSWRFVLDHEPHAYHDLNTTSEIQAINQMLSDGWQLVSSTFETNGYGAFGGPVLYFQRPRAVQP